jgi:hypothetical protein
MFSPFPFLWGARAKCPKTEMSEIKMGVSDIILISHNLISDILISDILIFGHFALAPFMVFQS